MAHQQVPDRKDATFKVLLDILLVILVTIPILVLKFAVPPYHRGFFCSDESIAHPFKENTIPTIVLVIVGYGGPILTMIFVELFLYLRSRKSYDVHGRPIPQRYYSFFRKNVHIYFVTLYEIIGAFAFGGAVCQTATDILKYNIGRLRPNFLAVCKPDWSKFSCFDENGHSRYVEDFVCNETHHETLEEARLSHPSGHASVSFYAAVYLVLYLQIRLKWRGSKLLCPFLQAATIYLALYCCTTRISDYWHHWSDVLGGAVLGSVIALLVVLRVSVLFKAPQLQDLSWKLTELKAFQNNHNAKPQDGYALKETSADIAIHASPTQPLSP